LDAFHKEAGIGPSNWFANVANFFILGSLKPISSGRDPDSWLKPILKTVMEEILNMDRGKGPSSLLYNTLNLARLDNLPRSRGYGQ
jgi:hypothetical protein